MLDVEAPDRGLVFCRTRDEVDALTETLNGRGYRAEALHGGMSQEQRDRVMGRLRAGTADLLVATDVAARGLDIEQLTPRRQLRRAVGARGVRAPDRPGRPGRAARAWRSPSPSRASTACSRPSSGSPGSGSPVEKVPTVADLRARRLELTRAALEEILLEDDLERFRVVVETLADEFDVMEVALAAVKLAHEAGGGADDEEEIPEVAPRPRAATAGPAAAGERRGERPRGAPPGRGPAATA